MTLLTLTMVSRGCSLPMQKRHSQAGLGFPLLLLLDLPEFPLAPFSDLPDSYRIGPEAKKKKCFWLVSFSGGRVWVGVSI